MKKYYHRENKQNKDFCGNIILAISNDITSLQQLDSLLDEEEHLFRTQRHQSESELK
jgi:hypothetical protein